MNRRGFLCLLSAGLAATVAGTLPPPWVYYLPLIAARSALYWDGAAWDGEEVWG